MILFGGSARDLALLFRLVLSIFLSRFLTKNLDSTASNDELLFWLDPKSPLERGGPLAVGRVLFETVLLTRPRQAAMCLSICSCSFPAKRALRPGVIFASLASTDAPQCIATADALRRIASCNF